MTKCNWIKPRIKIWQHFYMESLNDPELVAYFMKSLYTTEHKKHLNKGIHFVNPRIDSGYDKDGFIRNIFTVVITAYTVKVPRYLKERLKRSNTLPVINLNITK